MLTMTAISFSEVNFTSQFLNKSSTIVNQFTLLNQFKEKKKKIISQISVFSIVN